jgi:hypothetical protein
VVQDAEAKDCIKTFGKKVEMFDAEQFDPELALTGKGVESLERIVMLEVWLKSEDQGRLVMGHAEHVVTVVAADIGNDLVGKVGQLGGDTVPLAFAAPFGINVNTKNGKRALAPGHESPQDLVYQLSVAWSHISSSADPDDVTGKIAT